jgi:diguanylate cyclase (GGDEF)-like protein/PAS domain S-box-containing protein
MPGAIEKARTAGPEERPALDHHLKAALIDSRQRYKDLVEISSDFAWETDGHTFVFVSPHGALGYSAKDLVGFKIAALLDPRADAADTPFQATHPVNRVQFWCRAADGQSRRLSCSAMPIFDDDGQWAGARGVARDVTEESDLEEALARAHTRERLYNHVLTAIWDKVEPDGMLPAAADATRRALSGDLCLIWRRGGDGAPELAACSGALAGQSGEIVPPPDLPPDGAVALPAGEGQTLFAGIANKGGGGAVGVLRGAGRPGFEAEEGRLLADLAFQFGIAMAHVEHQVMLDRLARIDGLTELLVRRAFIEIVEQCLGEPGALLYVDLDNFKSVNDLHGHEAGDRILCLVAEQLSEAAGEIGLVARLGGDEFAIWLKDAGEADATAAAVALQKSADRLAEHSADPERPIRYSIGIAVHRPETGETLDALVARADAAMYAVKHDGKDGIAVAPPHGAASQGESEREDAP